VCGVMFSPDGSRVASGSEGQVSVLDVQTGQCQHILEGHIECVTSVVFSPDGLRLASGSYDQTVRVRDVVSLAELMCYNTETDAHKIEFNDDSMKIVVNSNVLPLPSQTQASSTASFGGTTARMPIPPPKFPTKKLGIKCDWIISLSRRILWLPPEYRPGAWASKGDIIATGSGTGRVTLVGYAATHSSPI
jgi:WD40 repeat protein